MYKVSKQYLERIYSGGAKSKAKIKFNGVELKDANRLIEKITIKRRILANGSERFSLDNFIATEIEMILHNVSLDTIKEPVDISIGTLVGDTYEYVPIGIFKIEGSPTTDKDKTTLQLRDNAIKFDFNYNAQPVIDNNGGSATLKQIFNNICELAEVETDVTSFNGEDLKFGIFDNTITARQYISYIAEQAGMMATIDRTGKLTFVDLNSDSAQIISGKTVTFDSELERSMSFQVNGNTEQTTYSGNQLLNIPDGTYTDNGITAVAKGGIVTLNGTATANSFINIPFNYTFLANTNYTLSAHNTLTMSGENYIRFNYGTTVYFPCRFSYEKSKFTNNFNENTIVNAFVIRTESGKTYNNFVIKPMLNKGPKVIDFEPYVGGTQSPNPDFPQEIENISGVENLFDLEKNSILNTENVDNYSKIKTGYKIITNNKANNDIYGRILIDTDKIASKKMVLSCDVTFSKSCKIAIGWASSNNQNLTKVIEANKKTHITLTGKIGKYLTLGCFSSNTTAFFENIMISKKEDYYVPYGSNYLILNNKSDNLANINEIKIGKTWQNVSINSRASIIQIEIKQNTTYTLNSNYKINSNFTTCRAMLFNNISDTVKYATNDIGTFNSKECNYLSIELMSNTSVTEEMLEGIWISLMEGTEASNIPYFNDNMLINLKGNELCSNKDKTVKDNLFVTNKGKVEIFKKIGEYVFTGNENWIKSSSSNSSRFIASLEITNIMKTKTFNALCNYFTYNIEFGIAKFHLYNTNTDGTARFIAFGVDASKISDLTQWKAFLKSLYDSGNPVKVQYELENPEAIELDTVTPLKSYIGQNNISNNADADMNVTYDLKRQPFEIPIRIVESLEKDETYKIGRVEYEDALRKFEQGEQDDYLYINSANPYISNQKQISDIYELLNGYTIDTFKTGKIIGNPALDGYDLIKFIYKNKEYITLNQGTLTFNGVMIQTNETIIGTEAKQSNVTVKSQAAKFKRAFTEIDAVNAQVKITTEQTNTIQDNLANNYYTIEQSNTLIQNAQSGLTNTFSEAGGNNIFRNTGLWFSQSDANNPYEYWTGKNVSKQNTDKSSNGSLMMLKKGTLEQEQVVSNGNYTVSFKYKKLIQLATCKVIVNDNEYELTQMTDTEWQTGSKDSDGNIVIKLLEVTSNHINVKFTSTVDNAIEIYDLMVNAGTVKLAYSQNENEVTTDTVNISKGITITSSANDTKFKANADGIRIVDKNNEKTTLTEFTDKGMSTKEMEVENGATIVKVLVQNVGNQTWFTRI